MKIKASYDVKLPDYSLSYLINADSSGIDESDIKIIDDYMQEYYDIADQCNGNVVIEIVDSEYAESYFSNSPEFGLPCNVMDCIIAILY
jgi:hypothetical protein